MKIPYFINKSSIVLIVFVLLGLGIGYYHRNAFYSVDDSFITYQYALNLLQGHGLVFNIGESYYGTTAAGYATLLALIAKPLFLIFPQLTIQNVSVGVSALSLMLVGACWWAMIPHERVRSLDAVVVWLIFVVTVFVAVPFNEVAGHETYAFLAFAFFACVLAARERMVGSGFLLGLAVTLRPDAILMVPIIILVSLNLWRIPLLDIIRDRRLLVFSGTFMALLVPWLIYLHLHFGRIFPGTMDAKRAQVAMGYWPLYKPAVMGDYVITALTAPTLVVLGFGLAVFAWFWRSNWKTAAAQKQPSTPALFVGACWFLFLVLSTVFYFAINVTFWRWYGVPVVFGLFIISYAGWVSGLAHDLVGVKRWALSRTLVVLAVGTVYAGLSFGVLDYWLRNHQINQHIYAYHEVADKLKALEPEGAVVAIAEPGAFAVRLGPKFKVVDELGLISPGVARGYLNGDHNYVYREFKPKYVVCSWRGAYSACDKPDVIKSYSLVGEYDQRFWVKYINRGAQLYRLKADSEATAEAQEISAISMVQNIHLGDKWGMLISTTKKDEIFVHPGLSTNTDFSISCSTGCVGLQFEARIADLPVEAPPEVGVVRVSIYAQQDAELKSVVVNRKTPASLRVGKGIFRIVVNNEGDPAYDWLVLRIIPESSE